MTEEAAKVKNPGRLMMPTLFMQNLSAQSGQILTSLLLIDIASTFTTTVGDAGQIRTISAAVAMIFAIIMGALSIAYNHKTLFALGALALVVSGITSPLSPTLGFFIVAYSFTGLGLALTSPMSSALIGEFYPREKRSGVISWTIAAMSISYLLGSLAIASFSTMGGWRFAFWAYVLPLYLIGFVMVVLFIPRPETKTGRVNLQGLLAGYKDIFLNRSAALCLAGYAFSMAAWQYSLLYGMSFLRHQFAVSTTVVSLILIGTATAFTVGGLLGGKTVNKYGRKRVTVLTALLGGVMTVVAPNVPIYVVYLVVSFVGSFISGMMFTAFGSLTLEQVPGRRGTMMSLSSASQQLGYTLGAGLGGVVLSSYGYVGLGFTLGMLGVVGALIVAVFVLDLAT